jgi:hypothetical protein
MASVMTSNHAHQKLFPSIIACPHLLLPLPIPLHYMQETPILICDWHVIKLQPFWTSDQYIVKLPTFLEPIVWHDVKLQACPVSLLCITLTLELKLL